MKWQEMWIGILKFVATLGFRKLTERLLRKTLSKKLLKIVRIWANDLPEDASVNADAIWVNPFAEIKSPQESLCSIKLQHQIQTNETPSEEVWFEAFLEKWKDVREHVEDPQPFFKLDERKAKEHIRTLSRAVYNEYTEDPVKFRRAAVDALYKRGHVDTESIEDHLVEFLRQQVKKQKKNLKYIPEVFTENFEAKEKCRFFVAPAEFWNKIIWDINNLNFSFLNRMLTKSSLKPMSIELPEGLEKPPQIDQVKGQSDRLLQILKEKRKALKKLREADKDSLKNIIPKEKFQDVWSFWHLVRSALWANSRNLEKIEQQIVAIKKAIVLITSEAGKGKTNFVCDLVENVLLKREVPSAFFTTRDFDHNLDNLLEYILQRVLIDSGTLTVKKKMDLLKNIVLKKNKLFVIVIDGLNESQNIAKFSARLEELLQQLVDCGFVKIILTCRSEYIEYRFDNLFRSAFADEILHVKNLDMRECEEKKIVTRYLDFFKLSCTLYGNAYYILARNPLMLRFFCEVHGDPDANAKKALGAVGNIYKDRLFAEYITKKIESVICTDYQGQGLPLGERDKYIRAIDAVVELMIEDKTYYNIPVDRIDTVHHSAIDRLIREDVILRKDILRPPTMTGASGEVINFTFDEFRDYLIASHLVTKVWPTDKTVFDQFTSTLIEVEERHIGGKREQIYRPSVVAEGVGRFIIQITRHGQHADLEESIKAKEWYQYTYPQAIFEIEDEHLRDEDILYVKKSFRDGIDSSSEIIYELIQRHDTSQYKNLNIGTLFEILRDLDDQEFSKLVNPVFQNYLPTRRTHLTWKIDALVETLRARLRSRKESPALFELLIFLFAIPSRNYLSPALDLYDEFTERHPKVATAQLANNTNIKNKRIRAHVFEKLMHLLQKRHVVPNLLEIMQGAASELVTLAENKDKANFGVGTTESKLAMALLMMEKVKGGLLTDKQIEILKENTSNGFHGILIC